MNTLSSLLANTPLSSSVSSPDMAVRAIVEKTLNLPPLPPTKSLSLYHIRGVSNPKFNGGEDIDSVIFGPEFLYVLDVGFPAACGVQIPWKNSGRGDPYFPKFENATLRSVLGRSSRELLYPCIPCDLLVGVVAGTDEATARAALAPHSNEVSILVPDLYQVKVNAFHESKIAKEIETSIPFVKYASMNSVVRLVDFSPGWFVDQIC